MRRLFLTTLVLIFVGFVAFFGSTETAQAQTCSPTRVINQFACVTSQTSCVPGQQFNICSFTGDACSAANPCGPAQGQCIPVCHEYQYSTNCQTTGTQVVSCSGPPSCQAQAVIRTCSGGGATPGSCLENVSTQVYGCWVTGGGGSSPGPTSPPATGCTSGDPFTGIANCGAVGRPNGSGNCGAGCLCCNPPGGGYTPGCPYDVGATGYPSCNFSEGNGCNSACSPPWGNCSGCANGLVGGGCSCPTCSISIPQPAVNVTVGQFVDVPVTVNSNYGWGAQFGYTQGGIVSAQYLSSPSRVRVTGLSQGSTNIQVLGWWGGYSPRVLCSAVIYANVIPACVPNCSPACGQNNGCGGTCPSTDAGAPPAAPGNLSPVNGTNVTPAGTGGNRVTISWSSPSPLTDLYEIQVGNVTNPTCGTPGSFCQSNIAANSISFQVTNGIYVYSYRVRAINSSCGSQPGPWSAWTSFGIADNITGSFYSDPNETAVLSGGVCVGASGGLTTLGSGAGITSVGVDGVTRSGAINGSNFSLYTYYWNPGNNTLSLNPGTAPNGAPYICTCPNGCQYAGINSPQANVNFAIKQNDLINGGWWQVRGGNVYAAQTTGLSIRSLVPVFYCTTGAGCIPDILAQNITASPDSAGGAVTGGGAVDSNSDAGNNIANVTQRSTQTVALGQVVTRVRENYDYFLREFSLGLNPSDDFASTANDATKPTSDPANGKLAYYHNGDMTIQQAWDVASDEKITVFVNGNLTIQDPSTVGSLITVEEGGFLAFIVKGNIVVAPSVGNSTLTSLTPNISGLFVADGTITFQGAGAAAGGDKKLVAEGTYVGWTNIEIQRDFDDGGQRRIENNTKSASSFIFRPDFVINAPEAMLRSSYIWQETN